MSRYKDTNESPSTNNFKRQKQFKRYETTYYQGVPKSNTDIYVTTQTGDRLDNLAFEFYGDPNLWWFIARVNHLKTMNLEAGVSLRIPLSPQNIVNK